MVLPYENDTNIIQENGENSCHTEEYYQGEISRLQEENETLMFKLNAIVNIVNEASYCHWKERINKVLRYSSGEKREEEK